MTSSASNRLFILDGMALAYRSHFAFITNPIRTSKGEVTSAIFGFANTLLSILESEKPTHIVACFDTSAPTSRHEMYPEYKANRQAMPEDLRAQIPQIFRLLEAFNIPILRYDGYEADDTIGTLTQMADEDGHYDSYMVSLDKDLGQLISEHTFLWKPGKRNADHEVVTLPVLLENWGIEKASQVIDILALMGDASDNIPGIPGVGEKTAKTLIEQFHSVENLLANTDQLKGKRRITVEENADKAILSKKLATIDRQVPLTISLEELKAKPYHQNDLLNILDEFELRTIKSRLFGKNAPLQTSSLGELFEPKESAAQETPPVTPIIKEGETQMELFAEPDLKCIRDIKHQYHIVTNESQQQQLLDELTKANEWCFDTETTGLDPLTDELLGIAFSIKPHEAWYVPVTAEQDLAWLAPVFSSAANKIGHNLKFDIQVIRARGLQINGPFSDTMVAHALIAPGLKHGMDVLAENLLNYTTIKLLDLIPGAKKKDQLDMKAIPMEILGEYSAEDADITLQLYHYLTPKLKESGMEKVWSDIEQPLLPVLADMEFEGINVDLATLSEASKTLEKTIQSIKASIEEQAHEDINLNSPKQLGEFLFNDLKLVEKPKKTKTGQYVTDEETLRSLAHLHPIVQSILDYRENSKLKSTYVDALPRYISPADGRIHTKFMQVLTATGRLASQDPNLQNIPIRTEQGRAIRAAFIPRNEHYSILSADYSQIELRIMAALSGDEGMCLAFKEGRDIHQETASRIYGVPREEVTQEMRRGAKTVNFGIIYGISAFGLSQRLNCPRALASDLIKNYFSEFPGIKRYMDSLIEEATEKGYAETLCGRRRYLPDLHSANKNIRSAAERTAINTPIQGTAADMIKLAMNKVHDLLKGTKSRLILQIHDELLVDLHEEEHYLTDKIKQCMVDALPLPHDVPILVEAQTGHNWLEAH